MFPRDEDLPLWLHTLLLAVVVAPFSGFLLFHGLRAVFAARLDTMMGPSFGVYLIKAPLAGGRAVVAGTGLLLLSASFLALAYAYSRFSGEGGRGKLLPWVLLGAGVALVALAQV